MRVNSRKFRRVIKKGNSWRLHFSVKQVIFNDFKLFLTSFYWFWCLCITIFKFLLILTSNLNQFPPPYLTTFFHNAIDSVLCIFLWENVAREVMNCQITAINLRNTQRQLSLSLSIVHCLHFWDNCGCRWGMLVWHSDLIRVPLPSPTVCLTPLTRHNFMEWNIYTVFYWINKGPCVQEQRFY